MSLVLKLMTITLIMGYSSDWCLTKDLEYEVAFVAGVLSISEGPILSYVSELSHSTAKSMLKLADISFATTAGWTGWDICSCRNCRVVPLQLLLNCS